MTAIDVAKAQEESDAECRECGRDLHAVGIDLCEGCCTHENIEVRENALLPDKCEDCGCKISGD